MSTLYEWFLRPDTFPVLHWPESVLNGPSIQDWDTRHFSNWGAGTAQISNGVDFDPAEARFTLNNTLYLQEEQFPRWSFARNLFCNFKIAIAQGGSLGDKHLTIGWADDGVVDFTAPHNSYGGAGDALFFEINTGIGQSNWHAVAIRAGAVSRVNTGSAPRVDGFGETLRIVWDGVDAIFYIDGSQVASIGSVIGPTLTTAMQFGVRGYSGDPGVTGGTFFGWDLLIFQQCYGGSP